MSNQGWIVEDIESGLVDGIYLHKEDAEFSKNLREQRYKRKMQVIEHAPVGKQYLDDCRLMKNADWHA